MLPEQLTMDDRISPSSPKIADEPVSQQVANAEQDVQALDPVTRARAEKSLKRKLDARFSILILIYIMNYLDRNNMAAARLQGLQKDLRLSDRQYETCLSILYVGYILMQVPSNMLVNRIGRPSAYMACAMLLWGGVSALSGSAGSFGAMLAIRFALGFVEAAFLPGALLVLSKWYTRRELAQRNALLFCGNLVSNAFSALVAAAVLARMDGAGGHPAWRWLFWIEGAVTMAVAVVAAAMLPDLPHNARGFTPLERRVAQLRILEDLGELDTESRHGAMDGLGMALKDVKIYLMMLTFAAYVVGLSFNAFFPSLTKTLGFQPTLTLLMSAPPWVFSCIVSLIVAWNSDRMQERFWHIVSPMMVGMAGFVICMSTFNTAARYVALFLQTSSYAGYIVFYSWIASTFPRPPAKRAVAIAMINAFAQLGNVAGSYVWNLEADGYRRSYGIVLAMFGVTILGCWCVRAMLIELNQKLAASEVAAENGRVSNGPDKGEDGALNGPDEALRMQKGFRYLV